MIVVTSLQDISEVDELIETKASYFMNHNLINQPYIIICGPLSKIEKIFVVLNEIKFDCGNLIIDGLYFCYKIFFAFSIDFSEICSHIWSFFHIFIFELEEKTKKKAIGSSKCREFNESLENIPI